MPLNEPKSFVLDGIGGNFTLIHRQKQVFYRLEGILPFIFQANEI